MNLARLRQSVDRDISNFYLQKEKMREIMQSLNYIE